MRVNNLQVLLFLSLLIAAGVASADAVSVDGPTYKLPDITALKAVNVQLSEGQMQQLTNKISSLQPKQAGFQSLNTVLKRCTGFKSKQVNIQHLPRQMFVIGDDQASFNWLAKYKKILEKTGAIGLVVKAKNINSLKQIRAATSNLMLYPANGDEVSKMFGISCYPVLISKRLIEH